jgi:hypothetical protein
MWFWIIFSPIGQTVPPLQQNNSSLNQQVRNNPSEAVVYSKSWFHRRYSYSTQHRSMSFCKKIYTLWDAPITKFYTNFLFYLIFLFLFTLAVIWPSCGNLYLDCVVWLWTASIAIENTRIGYKKFHVSLFKRN